MANWKKVIVSSSNAHLNNVTSSGNISASGNLFGNLPQDTDELNVVVYNPTTGQLEYKELNLISTERASRLALFERDNNDENKNTTSGHDFKMSYDEDNSISSVEPVILVSSSNDGGSSFVNSDEAALSINDEYIQNFPNADGDIFFNPPTDNISTIADTREHLDRGATAKSNVIINFQSVDDNNTGFPAYYNGSNLNFGARAFDRGGIGKLKIYINTMEAGSPTADIDLEAGNGAAITTTTSNFTMDLFATASNLGAGDAPDPTKHYRSGSMTIKAAAQNDGFNYAFALHTGSDNGTQFSYLTNVYQWFYDTEGAGLEMAEDNSGIISNPTFDTNATHSVSGIKFFNTDQSGATLKYGAEITNQYRNVYPANDGIQMTAVTGDTVASISVTQSGQHQTPTEESENIGTSNSATANYTLAALQDTSNAYTTTTLITASVNISFDPQGVLFYQPSGFIDTFTSDDIENSNNIITFTPKFTHVTGHKNDLSLTAVSISDYMLNQLSSGSNEYEFEDFRGEEYRIQSKSYDENDDPAAASHAWDGEKNVVNGGDGFDKGAIQYYSHLLYPKKAGANGTFNPSFGPDEGDGQPDNYNTATGEREYYRYFHVVNTPINQTGNKSINLEIVGSGKVVADGSTLFGDGLDGVKIFAMRNEGNAFSNFNGEFVNVVSNAIRDQGTQFSSINVHHIPMASSTSNIAYGDTTVTVGTGANEITVPRGVVKFGELEASANSITLDEEIIIKIVIPQNFSGYIDAILLNHGIQTTSRMNSQYSSAI